MPLLSGQVCPLLENPLTLSQPTFTLLRAKVIILQVGEVLELADRRDLGSRALGRVGSNPTFPTVDCSFGLDSRGRPSHQFPPDNIHNCQEGMYIENRKTGPGKPPS